MRSRALAKASGLKLERSAQTPTCSPPLASRPSRRAGSQPPVATGAARRLNRIRATVTEIIVTASKRDTCSVRFPGQWDGSTATCSAPLGVAGTEAIETRSVGFSSTHLGAGRNKLFIRGIADSSFSGPTQSPVGQYFGDMRTGYSGPDPDLKLVDMQSVEILEGPQGTLYGSGALGGIVLLKPNMPSFGRGFGPGGVGQRRSPGMAIPGYDRRA